MPAKTAGQERIGLLVPHGRRVSVRWMSGILVCGVAALAWAMWRPEYYRWAAGRLGRAEVVVFCDTSEFRGQSVSVLAQYDQVALSPIAQALGVYQNRPAAEAYALYSVRIDDVAMTPTTLVLKQVPLGPLVRVLVVAGDRSFHALVRARTVVEGRIHVRLD